MADADCMHTQLPTFDFTIIRWTRCFTAEATINVCSYSFRLGMGSYRYQIFDTVDIGLCNDGIDTCKQYRRVLIHVCAALHMHKVYISTRSREIGDVIWWWQWQHVNMFLNQNLWVVCLSVCLYACLSVFMHVYVVYMFVLYWCFSFIEYQYHKSIVSTVSKVEYSASHQTENIQCCPPLL